MRGNAGAITTITTIRRGKSRDECRVASNKWQVCELGTLEHHHALFTTNTTNTTMRGNAGAITTITTIRRGKGQVASGKWSKILLPPAPTGGADCWHECHQYRRATQPGLAVLEKRDMAHLYK
jgi:hypothetical protein